MGHGILAVDDLGVTRIELSNILKSTNIVVTNAKDKLEALNILHERSSMVNAIVWAINSADCKEFEDIKEIKRREAYKDIPVIIISKYNGKSYIIKAIEAGAVEYVARPYDTDTVVNKLHKVLGIESREHTNILEDDTVIFNFSEMFSKELKAASRGAYPLSLLLITVVPESPVGDDKHRLIDIVKTVCKVLKTKLRGTDTTFLYGNDNIIVLLPFTDREGVAVVDGKLQNIFNTHALIKKINSGTKLVVGSASFPQDGKIKTKLLDTLKDNLNAKLY